jgi:hypothetical protein
VKTALVAIPTANFCVWRVLTDVAKSLELKMSAAFVLNLMSFARLLKLAA